MRTNWNDNLVESSLRPIVNAIGYFPSARNLRDMGRTDLAVQIGRRGGFVAWSDRMSATRRRSDSDTGWLGEEKYASLLINLGYEVQPRASVKSPYDLVVGGVLRVDVKSASFVSYGRGGGWYYRIGKYVQSDLVVLFQLDTSDFYCIPWWECSISNVTISKNGGKWLHRKNDLALIDSMIAIRKGERVS